MEFHQDILIAYPGSTTNTKAWARAWPITFDGLLLSNYLTYWDYTHVETLLTLQNPKTDFPDEVIFIIYHQITELYFKLSLHELEQIGHNGKNILPNGQDLGWKDKARC